MMRKTSLFHVGRQVIAKVLITLFLANSPITSGGADSQVIVSVDDARALILAVMHDSKSDKLPGFFVEHSETAFAFPGFYLFSAMWQGSSPGSVLIGNYAVDTRTGDVWSAVACEAIHSPSLAKLQNKIRKRVGLSGEMYKTLKKPGPYC